MSDGFHRELEERREISDTPRTDMPKSLTGSLAEDTPFSNLASWFYDARSAETRARRSMTGYHVSLKAAQELERALNKAKDSATKSNFNTTKVLIDLDDTKAELEKYKAVTGELAQLTELVSCNCDTASYGGYVCPRCETLAKFNQLKGESRC